MLVGSSVIDKSMLDWHFDGSRRGESFGQSLRTKRLINSRLNRCETHSGKRDKLMTVRHRRKCESLGIWTFPTSRITKPQVIPCLFGISSAMYRTMSRPEISSARTRRHKLVVGEVHMKEYRERNAEVASL